MRAPLIVAIAVAMAAGAGVVGYRIAMQESHPGTATAANPPETPTDKLGATLHKGRGVVTGVSAPDGYLEVKHEPIASMQWDEMQMGFAVTDKKMLEGVKKGDTIEFEMRGLPNKDGDFVVERIGRLSGGGRPSPR